MMTKNKSIFNLIEIFTSGKNRLKNKIQIEKHCEQKGIHDFYCDSERPYVSE